MLDLNKKPLKFILNFNQQNIIINKNKLLVGSAEYCDIYLEDNSISPIHAILYVEKNLITVQDLRSKNGTFVNGIKVEQQSISQESLIRFGSIDLNLILDKSSEEIEDTEANIEVINTPDQVTFIQDSISEDFKFEEINKVFIDLPLLNQKNSFEYVNIGDEDETDPRIKESSDSLSIQMTVLSNGHVFELEHFPFNSSSFDLNNGQTSINCDLITEKITNFANFQNNQVVFQAIPNFEMHLIENKSAKLISSNETTITLDQAITYTRGSLQIIFKLVPTPPELQKTPFFHIEKSFQKDLAKVYSSLLLPMLLLLFIGVEPKIPEKEIAIVYKRKDPVVAQNSEFKSDQTANKATGNQGEQKEKPEQAQKVVKQTQKQEQQKTAAQTAKVQRKIASVKTYKFNAPSNLNSLFDSKIGEAKIAQKSRNIASNSIQLTDSSNIDSSRNNIKIAKIGNGTGATNYGVAGLSNKKGHQTAHIESETVIMGSMDPELLRKILQEYIPQFRHCYQQELSNNSEDLKGVIDLNFRINGNGTVSQINIQGKKTRFSKGGTNCVAGVLKLIHFPKPKGGGVVDVRQPLNFFSDTQRI